MRLLFVILAHDRPEAAAALAAALTDGATDARALIHFDARADAASFERLAAAAAGQDRVRLAAERVATPWGRWGLVQATLDALEEARGWGRAGDGWTPDRALLLSGACLPCRPVRALERFLRAHPRREFIEAGPASWIKGGIKEERYRHWFPFDFRAQRRLHHLFHQAQRILGVERRVPDGLIPRFGSQWWGLTWETCLKLLAHRVARPDHMRWFRWSWIPDEFAIQTLVAALVPAGRIEGRGLAHAPFDDDGRPVVFFDDHEAYVRGLDAFFFRKASPEATRLRAVALEAARQDDDGAPVRLDGRAGEDPALRAQALGAYGPPGQPFVEEQTVGAGPGRLARLRGRYVVLVGPPALTRMALAALPPRFTRLGELFDADRVDLGEGREALQGLSVRDARIRDADPLLYLMRVLDRVEGVAALTWSPFHAPLALARVLSDANAIAVPALPQTGAPGRDLILLAAACGDAGGAPARAMREALGGSLERRVRALADLSGASEPLRRLLPYAVADEAPPDEAAATAPLSRSASGRGLDGDGDAGGAGAATIAPLWWDPEGRGASARRAALDIGTDDLARLAAPEGAELGEALRAVWPRMDAAAAELVNGGASSANEDLALAAPAARRGA